MVEKEHIAAIVDEISQTLKVRVFVVFSAFSGSV